MNPAAVVTILVLLVLLAGMLRLNQVSEQAARRAADDQRYREAQEEARRNV